MKRLLRRLRFRDQYGISSLGVAVLGVGVIVAFCGASVAVVFPFAVHSAHVSCLRLSEQTGLPTRFARSGMEGECYIQVGGRWIPEDRWRAIDGSGSEGEAP